MEQTCLTPIKKASNPSAKNSGGANEPQKKPQKAGNPLGALNKVIKHTYKQEIAKVMGGSNSFRGKQQLNNLAVTERRKSERGEQALISPIKTNSGSNMRVSEPNQSQT